MGAGSRPSSTCSALIATGSLSLGSRCPKTASAFALGVSEDAESYLIADSCPDHVQEILSVLESIGFDIEGVFDASVRHEFIELMERDHIAYLELTAA